MRATGPRSPRLPKLGELRAREHTGKLAKMLGSGRFTVYAASFRFERGRWVVAITGVGAKLHHQRRSPKNRHRARVGVDLGVKTLAVVADEQGRVLHTWVGVKALQHAQARLKLANQSYSRAKRDSGGRKKAARRLGKMHARIAYLRANSLHNITTELARGYTSITIEDVNVAGMLQLRHWPVTSATPRSGSSGTSLSTRPPGTAPRLWSRTGGSRRRRPAPDAGPSTPP